MIDVVQRRDTGRPELVYGRRSKDVEHAIRLTDFALLFWGTPVIPNVPVGRTVADGRMARDGVTYWVEIDNSQKMTARQMAQKWARYGKVDGFILVVCRTEGRLDRLRKGAEAVKDVALFTTFRRLEASVPEPWVDWFGNTVRI